MTAYFPNVVLCVFELGLNSFNLFLYSTDDEQDEDVKNKVLNNLQSFVIELGQILKNVLCFFKFKLHSPFLFFPF